jgi:hypothetical protein
MNIYMPRLYHLVIPYLVLIASCAFGSETPPIQGNLIVCPNAIELSSDKPKGAVLIAWKIFNNSESFARFRTRDLGRLILFDPDGNEIKGEGLGVDHTKKYELKDYPIIEPHQTLYFPFSISFEVHHRLGICIKVKSDPNGQEGWIYPISKKGVYSVSAKYSVKKSTDDNPLWNTELETISGPGFGCQNFWEGDLFSEKIEFRIR